MSLGSVTRLDGYWRFGDRSVRRLILCHHQVWMRPRSLIFKPCSAAQARTALELLLDAWVRIVRVLPCRLTRRPESMNGCRTSLN